MPHDETQPAIDAFDTLTEGTVIRIPQYQNTLRVTFVSDRLLGIKFVNAPTDTSKSLVRNQRGLVFLIAGNSDKGEVEEITVITRPAPDDDDDEEECNVASE